MKELNHLSFSVV